MSLFYFLLLLVIYAACWKFPEVIAASVAIVATVLFFLAADLGFKNLN